MDVRLPNGQILRGVPEGTSRQDIIARVRKMDPELGSQMLNELAQQPSAGPRFSGEVPVRIPGTDIGFDVSVPESLEAAMIGGGRSVERLQRGAQDLWARFTGDDQTRADIDAAEAESRALYAPVREQAPIASMVGEALPAFALPMGAVGGTVAKTAGLIPRVGGTVGGLARTGIGDAILTGGLLGALDTESTAAGGAAGGAVGGLLGSAVGRVLRPVSSRLTGSQAAAAQETADLGLRLTPGQRTGSEALTRGEASLRSHPISAAFFGRLDEGNQAQINRIAAESIGEVSEEVTDQTLGRAADRIGEVFESVADEPQIALGDEFLDDIVRASSEFAESWSESPAAKTAIDKALDLAESGTMTGRQARDASSRLGKLARAASKGEQSDPLKAEAFLAVKDAIDKAITRSVSPEKAAALREASRQYRNLLLLEKPGVIPSPKVGNVSVRSLSNQMRRQRGTEFTRGRGGGDDLTRLGQVGRAFPTVGDSGTATRMALPLLAGGVGVGLSADDFYQGQPLQGLAQLAAPALLMAGMGRAYTGRLGGGYLSGAIPLTQRGRQVLTGAGARLGAPLGGRLFPTSPTGDR